MSGIGTFERFGSLYSKFDQSFTMKLVKKIRKNELATITSGNFSQIYIYDIGSALNDKKITIIKAANQNENLFREYQAQKAVYRISKNSDKLRVPEPYSFLSITNPINSNDESYIFMEYIEGPTYYRMMQEECANILGIQYPKDIHEKDDHSVEKILLPLICDYNEKQYKYIQPKYLETFGFLFDNKKDLSKGFKLESKVVYENMATGIDYLHHNHYSHNDLYQNPRNVISNGPKTFIIDFGLATHHNGHFSSTDNRLLGDLTNFIGDCE